MCSILGFGGWNSFYYYLIFELIIKLVKDDIFMGKDSKISINLKIANHKIMILLLGYISDSFFGVLLYLFFLYREYRRKNKRNSMLSALGIEYDKKSTLDLILELKAQFSKSDNNNMIINDLNDDSYNNSLNNSYINNNTIYNKGTNNNIIHSKRKISLIHNDLFEDITDNSFWYIILSCCLIVSKEFLNQIVYSTNDIFDYYFINLVIITLIFKYWFKKKIYKHQMLAVIIVIIASGTCLISCLFINNYSEEDEKSSIISILDGNYYKIFVLILLYIFLSFSFCTGIIIQKNLMEIKFISVYKIIIYKGLVGILGSSIGLIISSCFKCDEQLSKENKDIKEMKIFEFFVCPNEYKGDYYYDHFLSYFSSLKEGKSKEAIVLISFSFFHFFTELSLILINKFLSPTHYLIAESLYSLIHIPLNYLTSASYDEIKDELDEGSDIDIEDLYNAIVQTFGTRILKFIACFFDFIGYLIFLEIIELKFCDFNKNIKKNIEKRAIIDGNIQEDDNCSCDSDDTSEDSIENKDRDASIDKGKT